MVIIAACSSTEAAVSADASHRRNSLSSAPRARRASTSPLVVDPLRTNQADHTAIGRIDRNRWMQEQADVAAVPGTAEPTLAGSMTLKVQSAGVLDRQHMPPGHTLSGDLPGMHQHLVGADRAIGQERSNCLASLRVCASACRDMLGASCIASNSRAPNPTQPHIAEAAQFTLAQRERAFRMASGRACGGSGHPHPCPLPVHSQRERERQGREPTARAPSPRRARNTSARPPPRRA